MTELKIIIDDYVPTLDETDVNELVDFVVELFNNGVQNG